MTKIELFWQWSGATEGNRRRFMLIHAFIIGPLYGLLTGVLVAFEEMRGQPSLYRLLVVAGCTLVGGPLWGACLGSLVWQWRIKPRREKALAEERNEQLEQRLAELKAKLGEQ